MKLSNNIIEIARAYDKLLYEISLHDDPELAFNYQCCCQGHILPREQKYSRPPRLATEYTPMTTDTTHYNKEKLFLLAAFEATYHNAKTPLMPDMVPLIIDT